MSVALAVAAAMLPGVAAAIPAGMAYEKVTPSAKEKGEAGAYPSSSLVRSSVDGRRFTFQTPAAIAGSEGAIASNQVLSMLTEDGWVTRGITAPLDPDQLGAYFDERLGYQEFSDDLTRGVLLQGNPVLAAGAAPGLRNLYRRDLPSGGFVAVTPAPVNESVENGVAGGMIYAPIAAGGSSDLSHVVFESSFVGLTPNAPFGYDLDPVLGPIPSAYEWVDGEVRLVGILPDGTPAPRGAVVGRGVSGGIQPLSNNHYYGRGAISSDGSRIVFTTPGGIDTERSAGDIYVRLNGSSTKAVSTSRRAVPDQDGHKASRFQMATGDGGVVFFTSCEKLTDDATASDSDAQGCRSQNAVNNLYRFDVDSGVLTNISVGLPNVLAVTGTDPGGESVYFVTNDSANQTAAIHLWRNGTELQVAGGIVRQEEIGPLTSTSLFDSTRQTTTSADARYLAFTTSVPQDGQPTGGVPQLYVYDAEADDLRCISCVAVGGGSKYLARLRVAMGHPFKKSYEARSIDSAGRFVFFNTRTALVPEDVNNREDVYRYETATSQLELVSTGVGAYDAIYADNSADGGSVFFATQQQVIPALDDDSLFDVYVARTDARPYRPPVSGAPPCSADECQGPLAVLPDDQVAGSSKLQGSGNAVALATGKAAGRPSVSRVGTVMGASVKLRVRVPGRGALRATGKNLVGSRKVARRAGSYRVAVRLSERARRRLAREGRVRVWVTVRFTPSGGEASSVRVAVTFKAKERRKLASSRKER